QVVSEGLAGVTEQLPEKVHTEIAPISGITGEIMLLSLSSPDQSVSPIDLRSFAEFDLRQRLLSVRGVAQVVAIGGEMPEYQVNVRQDQLRLYDLTIADVTEAARQSHSIASAGYLPNVQGIESALRQRAQVQSAEDIRRTIVKYHDGVAVTLDDVADVQMGPAPPRGTAANAGQPAVVMSIKKAPFTNTLTMTDDIDRVLDQVEAGLPEGIVLDRHVMRQADFINASISNVTHKLRDASIIVAVIVVLFLLNVRASIITLTAIPLSIAMGLLFLYGMNMTLNVMTLGGLAIAVGEVVDDAIIDVENIMRRLRENARLPEHQRQPRLRIIFQASNEIRSAIVFATIIIVIVFVPLLFLQGVEGRFFRPMGAAYIVSILASLLVALTVVPALSRFLFRGKLGQEEEDGWLVRLLKRAYEPTLRAAIRFRHAVLAIALLATLGSLWLGSTFGRDFLPAFREGTMTIFIDAPPGTSLTESDRMVKGLDRRLSELEGVRAVVRRTGRAERDEHAHGVNRSEIQVALNPDAQHADVLRRIDGVLADLPGLNTEVGAPISHQLSHVLSGTQAAIAINVFGEDLPTLRRIAEDIEAALADVPGARDVLANREATIESLPIRYRHTDLARWGLTPASAAKQTEAAFNGVTVQRVNEGIRLYDLVVRLHPDQRQNYDDVRNLLLRGQGGALV
ncbi:MAG: efflux RND transporter permease subunit, partial [Phycisphaeraceae bacterium]